MSTYFGSSCPPQPVAIHSAKSQPVRQVPIAPFSHDAERATPGSAKFSERFSADGLHLDKAYTPIQATGSGACYDTKLELAANKSYGLASCLECGSGSGSPSTLRTQPGFVERQCYWGFAYSCGGDKCVPPPDCGGPGAGGAGVVACATSECRLEALRVRESGILVPLVVLHGAASLAATSTSDPTNTPQITKLNGMSVAMSSVISMLNPLLTPPDTTDLSYDFGESCRSRASS
jgi:hypothetical protein